MLQEHLTISDEEFFTDMFYPINLLNILISF